MVTDRAGSGDLIGGDVGLLRRDGGVVWIRRRACRDCCWHCPEESTGKPRPRSRRTVPAIGGIVAVVVERGGIVVELEGGAGKELLELPLRRWWLIVVCCMLSHRPSRGSSAKSLPPAYPRLPSSPMRTTKTSPRSESIFPRYLPASDSYRCALGIISRLKEGEQMTGFGRTSR